eukprot:TRINITY_DN3699_c1_g1_i1.p1 TRINITY_DN3699_c1_g1~~TRINITY_DN3699_c1_g1_i1.p1  ORF type:complete len:132 (+),score=40.74 TRINITY_DN3699_c1_g1_i1:50-397(+)
MGFPQVDIDAPLEHTKEEGTTKLRRVPRFKFLPYIVAGHPLEAAHIASQSSSFSSPSTSPSPTTTTSSSSWHDKSELFSSFDNNVTEQELSSTTPPTSPPRADDEILKNSSRSFL